MSETKEIEPVELEQDKKFFKTKRDKDTGQFRGFTIDKLKFLQLLYSIGFRRLDIAKARLFIKIINHRLCKEIDQINIEDDFFDYLKEEYGEKPLSHGVYVDDLINNLLNFREKLFKKEFLYRLKPDSSIEFNKDTKDQKFFYYKNGFIEITKDKTTFHKYNDLNKYIFESELLNRDINYPEYSLSYFEDFCLKICGEDVKRLKTLKTLIGYNLYNYSDAKMKATVFTDSTISENDEPNGRTGKTLLSKAIGYMISSNIVNSEIKTFCMVNGKDFDQSNRYKYQQASIDTKIIAINDVKKNFNVELLFNDITDGVTVEKKNQHPFVIYPKIMIITNRSLKIDGVSAKDRFIEFEFSDYFNNKRSPETVYKHWFFRDWDKQQWNSFDNFMISCVKEYLINGLIEPESINLNARKLKEHTSNEFIEFMADLNIQFDERYDKKLLYEQFKGKYSDYNNDYFKQKKFSLWLIYYTRYSEKLQEFNRDKDEEKSGDTRYIIFRKKIKE